MQNNNGKIETSTSVTNLKNTYVNRRRPRLSTTHTIYIINQCENRREVILQLQKKHGTRYTVKRNAAKN